MNCTEYKGGYSTMGLLLNVYLILLFLLPQNIILYLVAPLGMLLVSNLNNGIGSKWSYFAFTVLLVLAISLFSNLGETWVDLKSLLRALHLVICFMCFGTTKCTGIYKGTLVFIVVYLAVFQFAGILQLNSIVDLSYKLYPLSDRAELSFERSLGMGILEAGGAGERLFGIYHNANNCAIYAQILLIMLAIEKEQFIVHSVSKWLYYVLLLIIILMIMAAGSRTSFIVLIGIGLVLFGTETKGRFFEIGLIVLIFIVAVAILGVELRMFKVGDGMNSSFGIKMKIIEDYLKTDPSMLKMLFGCFSPQSLTSLLNTSFAGTDMDFGDLFVEYGMLFLFTLLIFLTRVFKSLHKKYKPLLLILLWMFSNGVFCNFRTSTILLLVLSIYVLRSNSIVTTQNTILK